MLHIVLYLSIAIVIIAGEDDCQITIRSSAGSAKTGNFSSPGYPNQHVNGTRCTYKFVGEINERVQIKFFYFSIHGSVGIAGRCGDYIDVYTLIDHPDHEFLDLTLHGRYCGRNLSAVPHLLMSWNRTLVVVLDTDNEGISEGFLGQYFFVDSTPYNVGTPSPLPQCGYTIRSVVREKGVLVSPLYPAVYADSMLCHYLFEGKAGERVKVEFDDFALFHGGDHCPFDYVRLYDGYTSQDALIGTFCGSLSKFAVYSTRNVLYIEFQTRSGRTPPAGGASIASTQLRGFNATYWFSRDFVNLDFMPPGAIHLRGTECDVRLLSSEISNGTIASPNYPDRYPPNVTCFYYLDGRLDKTNPEKVELTILKLDIPRADSRCQQRGYLAAFLHGQSATIDAADKNFCGDVSLAPLVSKNPRMALKFDTHNASTLGKGFLAQFRFVSDNLISSSSSVSSALSVCRHVFASSSVKTGRFESPRHAPSGGIGCTYEFHPLANEYVFIDFEFFNLGTNASRPTGTCGGDRDKLEIYSTIILDRSRNATMVSGIGTYCGATLPGPVASDWSSYAQLSLSLRTGSRAASDYRGFAGRFYFLPIPKFSDRCGTDYHDHAWGIIMSPGYPETLSADVVCTWRILSTKPGSSIYLNILDLDMAGSSERGCSGTVLRIYTRGDDNMADYELCGRDMPKVNIISKTNHVKIRYLATLSSTSRQSIPNLSVSQQGFKIQWQVLPAVEQRCSGFVCNVSSSCIPAQLVCNGNYDCGSSDVSDEEGCPGKFEEILYIIIAVAAVAITIIIAALVGICLCIRRLHRRQKNKVVSGAPVAEPAVAAGHATSMVSNGIVQKTVDPMMTHCFPPTYASSTLPNAYMNGHGRPYNRCPSTSSSSGRGAMTHSTWLSMYDTDSACLTVL